MSLARSSELNKSFNTDTLLVNSTLGVMIRTITAIIFLLLAIGANATEIRYATEEEVTALGKAISAGNRVAVKKLFKLHADGAVAEEIDIILGRQIRSNPTLFLEGLRQSWRAECDACLSGLVGNTGDELVERFNKQIAELKARRISLSGVNNQTLRPLRDKCLRALEADIKEVSKAIQIEAGKTK